MTIKNPGKIVAKISFVPKMGFLLIDALEVTVKGKIALKQQCYIKFVSVLDGI